MLGPPGNPCDWLAAPWPLVTSHGSRREVTVHAVSRWPLLICPACAANASIEWYKPSSSWLKLRRLWMLSRAASPVASFPPKNIVLLPAT